MMLLFLITSCYSAAKAACYAGCATRGNNGEKQRCHQNCYNVFGPFNASPNPLDWARGCFSNLTTFKVFENRKLILKQISDIKPEDLVLTSRGGNDLLSSVLFNEKSYGNFTFFRLNVSLNNKPKVTKTLEVTSTHGILVIDRSTNETLITLPDKLKTGSIVLTEEGEGKITSVSKFWKEERFTLVTKKGSAFASGVLVSTICDDAFKEGMKFPDVLRGWKLDMKKFIFDQ